MKKDFDSYKIKLLFSRIKKGDNKNYLQYSNVF